jgi:hypothetical protein
MLALTNLLILTLALTALYVLLGVLSFALERGSTLMIRRPRRIRTRTLHRVRRRTPRPRRAPGAVVAPARVRVAAPPFGV